MIIGSFSRLCSSYVSNDDWRTVKFKMGHSPSSYAPVQISRIGTGKSCTMSFQQHLTKDYLSYQKFTVTTYSDKGVAIVDGKIPLLQ